MQARLPNISISMSPLHFWIGVFVLSLLSNGLWYYTQQGRVAIMRNLPDVPPPHFMQIASMGEPAALARATMLWLQAFDNQAGVSIAFRQLDYARLQGWLDVVSKLDKNTVYPLMAASRIYTSVNDDERLESIMEYVYSHYHENPKKNWPWLAQVAVLAKHRLHDNDLALKYANALADSSRDVEIPAWARQIQLVLLDEMGEQEALRILIGGLLVSGQVTDAQEQRFLELMLERMRTTGQDTLNQQ